MRRTSPYCGPPCGEAQEDAKGVKDARQARRGEGTKEGKQDEEGTKEGKQDEEDDQLDAAALTEKYDRLAFGAPCPRAGLGFGRS